jgi:tripartite-type tricarboxylate transporter receptor subunit TctC
MPASRTSNRQSAADAIIDALIEEGGMIEIVNERGEMKVHRRAFLKMTAAAMAVPAITGIAKAQAYPSRNVRIIVGLPPGGAADIVARVIAQWLSERLHQPFVVENRPGAGSNIATEAVVRAAPDGYTLLLSTVSNAIAMTLYDKLNFDFVRDLIPIAAIDRLTYVLLVHPSVPVNTVSELIAYAKSNPGKLNHAVAAVGSGTHLAGELFKRMAEIDVVDVPYLGSPPAYSDLLTGQVQLMVDVLTTSFEYISTGKVRALGVTTARRSGLLPEVATISETLPGYEASGWLGLCAPAGTPPEVVEKLNSEVNSALADPKVKARLSDLGGEPLMLSAAEFGRLMSEDTNKWGKVIRAANIKGN